MERDEISLVVHTALMAVDAKFIELHAAFVNADTLPLGL
jgi:hypothetical protein